MNTSDRGNNTLNSDDFTTNMDMRTFIELLRDNLSIQEHLPEATIERIARETLDYTRRNNLCRTPGMVRNFIRYRLEERKHLN